MRCYFVIILLTVIVHLSRSQDALDEYTQTIQRGMLDFGIKLNRVIQGDNPKYKNIVFSPINIYAALTVLHYGSDGITRDELNNALGIPKSFALIKVQEIVGKIIKSAQSTRQIRSYLADALLGKANVTYFRFTEDIFAQNGLKLKQSYLNNIKTAYGTRMMNVDLQKKSQEAADIINDYIVKITQNHALPLYTSPQPPKRFVVEACALIDTLWEVRFEKKRTKLDLFYMDNGNVSISKMMFRTLLMPYADIRSVGVVAGQLILADSDYSMYVVLPTKKPTLTEFLRTLTSDQLKTIINETSGNHFVDFKMPRFTINWSQVMNKHLNGIGVNAMFSDQAQFKNMIDESFLKVDEIGHSTDINVVEQGTKSSSIRPLKYRHGMMYLKKEVLYLNRAFFFFIYHRVTQTVLFYGTVHDPNELGLLA